MERGLGKLHFLYITLPDIHVVFGLKTSVPNLTCIRAYIYEVKFLIFIDLLRDKNSYL